MEFIKKLAFVLTIIGGLKWGLVGFFNFDLVAMVFGPLSALSRIVYALVGISSVWLIFDHSCHNAMEHKHA